MIKDRGAESFPVSPPHPPVLGLTGNNAGWRSTCTCALPFGPVGQAAPAPLVSIIGTGRGRPAGGKIKGQRTVCYHPLSRRLGTVGQDSKSGIFRTLVCNVCQSISMINKLYARLTMADMEMTAINMYRRYKLNQAG